MSPQKDQCLLFFSVGVLSNAYRVLPQTRLFSRDVPKQTGRSVEYRACADSGTNYPAFIELSANMVRCCQEPDSFIR